MFDTDLITGMVRSVLPEADFVRVTPVEPEAGADPEEYEGLFICETESPDHFFNPCPRTYLIDMNDLMMRRINGSEVISLEDA
jgi:hypothetical protein